MFPLTMPFSPSPYISPFNRIFPPITASFSLSRSHSPLKRLLFPSLYILPFNAYSTLRRPFSHSLPHSPLNPLLPPSLPYSPLNRVIIPFAVSSPPPHRTFLQFTVSSPLLPFLFPSLPFLIKGPRRSGSKRRGLCCARRKPRRTPARRKRPKSDRAARGHHRLRGRTGNCGLKTLLILVILV